MTPTIFDISDPIGPNDTALVLGSGMASAAAEMAIVPSGAPGSPLAPAPLASLTWYQVTTQDITGRSLKAGVPAAWAQGIYATRIRASDGLSATKLVNAPDPRWIQGDYGPQLEPGGTLYVSGICLEFSGTTATAVLVQSGVIKATLTPTARLATDRNGAVYCLTFALPALAAGDYDLYLHNGLGGSACWTKYSRTITSTVTTVTVSARTAWPQTQIDVSVQAGATTDDKLAAAIALIPNGGILHFPAGAYTITQRHAFKYHVLDGPSPLTTTITWTVDPGGSGLYGTGTGIGSNRYPFSTQGIHFIMPDAASRRIVEQRFVAEFFWHDNCIFTTNLNSPHSDQNDPTGIYLGTTAACRIKDCTNASGGNCVFASNDATYVLILNQTSSWRGSHIYIGGRCHSWIYQPASLTLLGSYLTNAWAANDNPGAWVNTFNAGNTGAPYTQSIMICAPLEIASVTPVDTSNRVGWTKDGMDGFYFGGATSSGTTITLAGTTRNDVTYDAAGALLYVADGTGAGQIAKVTVCSQGVGSVTIAAALAVALDGTSVVSICSDLSEIIKVGGTLATTCSDGGLGGRDNINAGCDYGTVGGVTTVRIEGGTRAQGYAPNARSQNLNCRAVASTVTFRVQSQDLASPATGYVGPLVAGVVQRGQRAAGGVVVTDNRCLQTPAMRLMDLLDENSDGVLSFDDGSDGTNYVATAYRLSGGAVTPSPLPSGVTALSSVAYQSTIIPNQPSNPMAATAYPTTIDLLSPLMELRRLRTVQGNERDLFDIIITGLVALEAQLGIKASVAPATGGTVAIGTVPDGVSTYLILPSGAITTGNTIAPANPTDGQIVRLVFGATVPTTINFTANTGQTVRGGASITAAADTTYAWVYNLANTTWYRVQ